MPGVDYIKVYKGEDGQFYWGAYSANHEEVSQGEGYTRLFDAETMARSLFPHARVLVEAEDPDGSS
jgi:uncharacterized protein YegP (UPF0339 family)